jgi:tRNA nucleotidyltransferase (CCA-adding enzyme)
MELDAFRQPFRFQEFLRACEADTRGRSGLELSQTPAADRLKAVLNAALTVDAGKVAQAYETPDQIKDAIFEARLAAIRHAIV